MEEGHYVVGDAAADVLWRVKGPVAVIAIAGASVLALAFARVLCVDDGMV